MKNAIQSSDKEQPTDTVCKDRYISPQFVCVEVKAEMGFAISPTSYDETEEF